MPHVRLGQSADLVVVAPATADLLARAAHGLADDLLTNVLLTARCPVLLAPAMHTEMWEHAATQANVATLRSRGVQVLEPAVGRLTGKDSGKGRLPEPAEVFDAAVRALTPRPQDLAGRRVVVSAGGTREHLDPVRFLGNRSSGKQGYALARAAAERGAEVVLVSTVALPAPAGVRVVPVTSALELRDAVLAEAEAADVVVMAAAVADYRPVERLATKRKKTDTLHRRAGAEPRRAARARRSAAALARCSSASPPRPATPRATCSRTAAPSWPARAATCSSSTRSASPATPPASRSTATPRPSSRPTGRRTSCR